MQRGRVRRGGIVNWGPCRLQDSSYLPASNRPYLEVDGQHPDPRRAKTRLAGQLASPRREPGGEGGGGESEGGA